MERVLIEDSCIGCGSCVEICPEVFELEGELAVVKGDAELSLDTKIIEAAESCPVEAIIYES
ncbi:MAG: ferredoxin [Deltaproteobacteria bacterium]|nr:ferredoxin [Deltaproteobacteria bacterium]